MAACPMLTFNSLSKAAWEELQQLGAPYGVVIDTDVGSIDKAGFVAHWNYNAATQTLSVQCTEHPFIVSCATIVAQINEHVRAVMAKHGVTMNKMVMT
jgi:hypothetical protein